MRAERNRASLGLWLSLAIGLVGCDDNSSAPTANPAVDLSAEPAFDYLPVEASYKKSPLKIASAVAFSRGGSALHVSLSTHPLTCKDLKQGVQREPGEVAVDLTLSPLLEPDGKESWAVTRARFGKVTRQGNLSPVSLSTSDPAETILADLDARISFPPDELTLKGGLEISGCGLKPWDEKARVLEQSELTVTLAGKKLPMNGATFDIARSGERTLRISTEPHACQAVVGSDVAVLITLPKDFEQKATATTVRAEGYMLPRPIGAKDPSALTVTSIESKDGAAKDGGSEDGAAPTDAGAPEPTADDEARFELAGELELSGYALTIAGTVTAQRCDHGTPRR